MGGGAGGARRRAVEVEWWLGGSAALAVRGADVVPRDVDVVTSAAGAEELARRLDDLLDEPLTVGEGWIATHFANEIRTRSRCSSHAAR